MHRVVFGFIAGAMLLLAQPALAHSPTSGHCNPETSKECRTVSSNLYVHYPANAAFGGCLDLAEPIAPTGGRYQAYPTVNSGPVVFGPYSDSNIVEIELTCFGPDLLGDERSGWDVHGGNPPAAPIELRSERIWLTWYLAVDLTGIPEAPSAAPGMGVYAVLEAGETPFEGRPGGQGLPGRVIAEGDVGTGYGAPSPGGTVGLSTLVDVRHDEAIYEFLVPMDVRSPEIPSYLASDFLRLTVVPYQVEGQGVGFTQPRWRAYTDPEHATALQVTTGPTLHSAVAQVTPSADRVDISWDVASPFGPWAVNTSSVRLAIHGPRSIDLDDMERTGARVLTHDNQFGPVDLAWTYPRPGGTPLPPGIYTFYASIETIGGHDRLTWKEPFTVPVATSASNDTKTIVFEGETATLPGPGVPVLLLLLALAGARTWRRASP